MPQGDGPRKKVEPPPLEVWQAWVRKWQPRLRLNDWAITVELVPNRVLENSNNSAECWSNHQHMQARIMVGTDIVEQDLCRPDLQEWEQTLIHELLHCRFDPACDTREYGFFQTMLYEQAINMTADALVKADRAVPDGFMPNHD